MGLGDWYKRNKSWLTPLAVIVTLVGGLLWIINLLGFSTSPSHYYAAWKSLGPDIRINVVLLFNIIFTLIMFTLASNGKRTESSSKKPAENR